MHKHLFMFKNDYKQITRSYIITRMTTQKLPQNKIKFFELINLFLLIYNCKECTICNVTYRQM